MTKGIFITMSQGNESVNRVVQQAESLIWSNVHSIDRDRLLHVDTEALSLNGLCKPEP